MHRSVSRIFYSPSYRLKQYVLELALALVLGGCTMLPPKQDRTRFIILAPVIPAASNSAQATNSQKFTSSLAVGLGPIELPEYLDRPELVIRTSANGLDLSGTYRWAEPVGDNFRHVLANDLTGLLGTTNIKQFPWYPGTHLDFIVRVAIQRFEADTSRRAELVAHWDLRGSQADQVLATGDARVTHSSSSLTGDAIASALSNDVAELAQQIASAIIQVQQQRVARSSN
jgi:uncharacterized protein